ncbi:FAD binding domain-containing protein [Mycolicibacterium houstonense]|uniref:FAD binding domain-containing protein n=1 Tax=Mycolicibacterium houstonense TaxID=146021 RepID=UPI0008333456|nr:xanthine dehydrogenase family protein subunit M [Mycolicibacterium houstonense]
MKTFAFTRAETVDDAVRSAAAGARYYAGGTNLLDLMKLGVEAPTALVDIGRLTMRSVTETSHGGVLVGAGVTNSAAANHRLIRERYPVLSQAILSGATTQIRNMATVGGNLMQRTRCPYFMDPAFARCNKREPGTGCAARGGFNREHALFGASEACVAVHPSDMAVALALLDARVHVRGPAGGRTVPIGEFFVLPGVAPERDNSLLPAELITAVELPPSRLARHSWYLKVRDRHSYAFALVSVAAGIELADGVIASAGLALGGVAAKPWRSATAETALIGARPGLAVFRRAAELIAADAVPLAQNRYKIDLAKNSVVRALQKAVGVTD